MTPNHRTATEFYADKAHEERRERTHGEYAPDLPPNWQYRDDAGEYYRRKDEEARRLSALYDKRKKEGASERELKRIERDLERARYVGD